MSPKHAITVLNDFRELTRVKRDQFHRLKDQEAVYAQQEVIDAIDVAIRFLESA